VSNIELTCRRRKYFNRWLDLEKWKPWVYPQELGDPRGETPIQFTLTISRTQRGLTVGEARRQDGMAIYRPVCDMLQNLFPMELEHIQRHGPLDEEIAQVAAKYEGLAGERLSTALQHLIKAGGVL
jgi:hypothetical protein